MDPMESSSEEKIGLAPEMRSLDEDLDQLIFNPVVKPEMRSLDKDHGQQILNTSDQSQDRRDPVGPREEYVPIEIDPKDPALVQEQLESPKPSKNWDLGPVGGSPKLAHVVDEAMKRMSEGEVRDCDDGEVGKPKFGEIGIIEDGLDHELEEVTFIPGTQVPDDGTSSVEEVSSSKEPELEELKLEAEDDGNTFIPGTAVPDNAEEDDREGSGERDVVFLPGSPEPEIGVRIPEIEARFRDSLIPKFPAGGGSTTPDPPRHKISWGDDPPKVLTSKLRKRVFAKKFLTQGDAATHLAWAWSRACKRSWGSPSPMISFSSFPALNVLQTYPG